MFFREISLFGDFGIFGCICSARGLLVGLFLLFLELGHLQDTVPVSNGSSPRREDGAGHTLFLAAANFSALTRSSSSAMISG